MRLQKNSLRKIGNKEYHKYVVNIPPKRIEESEFKEGDELEIEAIRGKITIKKKN